MTTDPSSDVLERLRGLLSQATARPWTAFDRDGVMAVMKGKEPPLKANGFHSRRWPEIVKWTGFDGTDVPKRYQSPNLHLIVEAVNALPELLATIERLSAELDLKDAALEIIASRTAEAAIRGYARAALSNTAENG